MTSKEMAVDIRAELPDEGLAVGILAEALERRLAKMPPVWRWIFGKGFRFAVEVLREIGK